MQNWAVKELIYAIIRVRNQYIIINSMGIWHCPQMKYIVIQSMRCEENRA